MPANLLSVNGVLTSLFDSASVKKSRSPGYKKIEIGKPLVARYRRIFVKWGTKTRNDQELMISTHVKTTEEKSGAAEAINYYNPEAEFFSGEFRLSDFGAQHYGHELCYYTKSYLGESIRFTTRIMELDGLEDQTIEAIQGGISTVAGLPSFASFLPYAALASAGITVFQNIVDLFNKDDVILPGHDLDLHFNQPNARRLQSGRIVCISDPEDGEDVSENQFINNYELTSDNQLVEVDSNGEFTNVEYRASTYFVLQLNCEPNRLYENFDYFQSAAELLAQTNRGGDPREFVDTIVSMAKAFNDVDAVRQIEDLALDISDPEAKTEAQEKIRALAKHITPDIRRLYQDRLKEILPSTNSP